MKIYTSLLVFASELNNCIILTDKENQPPTWILTDDSKDSLDIVRTGLYSISGVSPVFYSFIEQSGVFEFFDSNNQEKLIYIIYTVYFPSKFALSNESYMWSKLNEISNDNKVYSIIRYVYGNKQYVQKTSLSENRMPTGRKVPSTK